MPRSESAVNASRTASSVDTKSPEGSGMARSCRSVREFQTDEALLNALSSGGQSRSPDLVVSPTEFGSSPNTGTHEQEQSHKSSDWLLESVDNDSSLKQSVESEAQRLRAVRSLQILDTGHEAAFDELTNQAYERFDVRWACVSVLDLGREWFKSMAKDDLALSQVPRCSSFGAHTILSKSGWVEIPDALQDQRFGESPMVKSGPKFRYYAGVALEDTEGNRVGTFCLLDNKPRGSLNAEEKNELWSFAQRTQTLLQNRQEAQDDSQLRKRSASDASVKRSSSQEEPKTQATGSPLPHRSFSLLPRPAQAPSNIIRKPSMAEAQLLPDPKTDGVDPDSYLLQLVESLWGTRLAVKPALELNDYFVPITEDQVSAYNMETVGVCRKRDLSGLQRILREQGRESLDCFNRFGEGLLNMACRRGMTEIVQFLLEEAKLDVRVCDDYGRTPCHDACWHPEPNLDVLQSLLTRDPSLLLIADKRGYTPFAYARKSDWMVWRQFVYDQRHLLSPLSEDAVVAQFGKV